MIFVRRNKTGDWHLNQVANKEKFKETNTIIFSPSQLHL